MSDLVVTITLAEVKYQKEAGQYLWPNQCYSYCLENNIKQQTISQYYTYDCQIL